MVNLAFGCDVKMRWICGLHALGRRLGFPKYDVINLSDVRRRRLTEESKSNIQCVQSAAH